MRLEFKRHDRLRNIVKITQEELKEMFTDPDELKSNLVYPAYIYSK